MPPSSVSAPPLSASELVSAFDLSKLTGVSMTTIRALARSQTIPRPVGQDEAGNPLFDLADPKLSRWVRALQAAGYNRR